ncbi:uncharacterized protein LOC144473100 isoform X2 [Augochlora pura]
MDYTKINRRCNTTQTFIARVVESYFVLLLLVVASQTMNLLRLVRVAVQARGITHILPPAAIVIGELYFLAVINSMGQMIINNSMKFFLDTYACLWYGRSVPAQKCLLFIMVHSMKECAFLVGGLFCPSYDGFTTIVKLSVSYLIVIYSLQM